MRILYLIPCFPMLSETFISQELIGIAELGHEVVPVAFRRPSDEDLAKCSSDVRSLAVRTRYLKGAALAPSAARALTIAVGRTGRLNARLSRDATAKVSGVMRLARAAAVARLSIRERCDHLHAHWPPAAQVGALVHSLVGLPYSMSIHAHEATHDDGHFGAVFETVRFASFCNRAVMDRVMDRVPGARGKSYLVYHGVNLDRFAHMPEPACSGELRVASAGRLSAVKHFERLIGALGLAVKQGLNVRLTIVGGGTVQPDVERQAQSLGVADRLTITGWLPHTDVARHLANAHVFTLMADDYGLPNVVLEAQAVGRPIILSPMTAAQEAVEHGRNGWIVSRPDAIEEVVEYWRRLIDDPELLVSTARAARQFVTEHHDRRVHLKRLSKLFQGHCATQPTPVAQTVSI